ncbi:MAG: CHAT domain-containing protein [Kutzneria sp.]|nr:CHAT domain-containing protein [Kutzneria sp.]
MREQQSSGASKAFRRALRLLDRLGPDDGDSTGTVLRIRVLVSLAHCDTEVYGLRKGTRWLDAASELSSQLPEGGQRLALESLIQRQRGTILWLAGRLIEAIPVLDEAVVMTERSVGTGATIESALANVLTTRALLNMDLGKPGPASEDLRRCLWIGHTSQSPMDVVIASSNLGMLHSRTGDIPTALRYYEQAERLLIKLAPSALPKLDGERAEALLFAGLAEEAARSLDKALPALRAQGNNRDLAVYETQRAAAALLGGDPGTARRFAAIARRGYLRQGMPTMAAVAALISLRAEIAEVLLDTRPPTRRLVTKALALSDELASFRLADESDVAQLLGVRVALRRRDTALAAQLLDGIPPPRQMTSIDHRMLHRLCRAELAVATGNRRKAFSQARAGFAELGRIRDRMGGLELVCGTAVHGRELGELAIRLVLDGGRSAAEARRLFDWLERTRAQVYRYEPQPAVEDPVLAERVTELRSLTMVMRQAKTEGRRVRELAARHSALQQEATRLGWQSKVWGRPRPVASLGQVAGQLGDRALVSFATSGEAMVAVVIADGRPRLVELGGVAEATRAARELHADLNALAPDHLPKALIDVVSASARRRARRLDEQLFRPLAKIVADRELIVVPTGPLYRVAWGALPSLRSRPVAVTPSATAWLAASAVSGSTGRGRSVLIGGPGLPAAVGEVAQLARYRPDADIIDGDRATVEAVLDALDGTQLAHIAAHGEHEPDNALFSRLDLVDGALFAHETTRLRRPPEQVVLAACELALNRIRPGDEALGFAGALLAAGVRTVTAAVTRVGDHTAAESMAFYHRRVAEGAEPAVALADSTAVDPLRRPFMCFGAGR